MASKEQTTVGAAAIPPDTCNSQSRPATPFAWFGPDGELLVTQEFMHTFYDMDDYHHYAKQAFVLKNCADEVLQCQLNGDIDCKEEIGKLLRNALRLYDQFVNECGKDCIVPDVASGCEEARLFTLETGSTPRK